MNIETKILLVRLAGAVIFIGAAWLGWWMDYRWSRSPFYRKNDNE